MSKSHHMQARKAIKEYEELKASGVLGTEDKLVEDMAKIYRDRALGIINEKEKELLARYQDETADSAGDLNQKTNQLLDFGLYHIRELYQKLKENL